MFVLRIQFIGEKAREITSEEVMWLKFLVYPGSVNDKLVEDLPHKNATLFFVFAERLQAMMDDLGPKSMFPEAHTFVRLEDLLTEMHKAVGSPNFRKVMFTVYDAMAFCERLSQWGRCR